MKLFDAIYKKAAKAIKGIKKPFVKNALERKFGQAIDNLSLLKDSKEVEILEKLSTVENVNNLDLEELIQLKLEINVANESIQIVEEIKEMLFNTDVQPEVKEDEDKEEDGEVSSNQN